MGHKETKINAGIAWKHFQALLCLMSTWLQYIQYKQKMAVAHIHSNVSFVGYAKSHSIFHIQH